MTPTWRKSTYSGGSQGGQSDCVEVADLADRIGIRDSKNPAAPDLTIPRSTFHSLLAEVKADLHRS